MASASKSLTLSQVSSIKNNDKPLGGPHDTLTSLPRYPVDSTACYVLQWHKSICLHGKLLDPQTRQAPKHIHHVATHLHRHHHRTRHLHDKAPSIPAVRKKPRTHRA
ncbi:ROP interactive partner 2 [Striga asiatica]|uniref:ROP interactive partner 2 n=1 Tax=Striga asiatica TaxID=4170 RepID=A0A5A7PTF3_STRAF|nr:ROP interactive partner 2 [Striga asiatica]